MNITLWKTMLSVGLVALFAVATSYAVHKYQKPGQLDPLSAQAMDMSQMRPPTGASPVALVAARQGSLDDTVTYTGSVLPYNEQDIEARIAGTVLSLPVYPGDRVRQGQLLVRLDSAEVGAKEAEASANLRQAQIAQQAALLTHHLHHYAALDEASSQKAVAQANVADAQAEVQGAQGSIADANAAVQTAQANVAYWTPEIAREKTLADQGAVSRQEYQNELAQAQTADAALSQAKAKVAVAIAMRDAANAKLTAAQKQVDVASAGEKMADADLAIAVVQADEAGAGADAAVSSEREAEIVTGYTKIMSPANGIVASRPVAPGTLVQPGTTILTVDEIECVRVQANVSVTDMAGIHVGSPVSIALQGAEGSKAIAASVTSVFPDANSDTRTDVVEAVIPNPHDSILPGAFVSVRITKSEARHTLLAPASSLVEIGSQSYVWTAASGPTGVLEAREVPVTTGASDGDWTEILSGAISPGDRIVTRGQAGLAEGVEVIAAKWGPAGPDKLPTAAETATRTIYRCEKCGMTFSAEDAKRNNYIDPMDGGKLVPVKPASGAM